MTTATQIPLEQVTTDDINELSALVCKDEFYEFFIEFWPTVCPETLVPSNHIKYLCDELDIVGRRIINREPKLYDLCINVPPGSSKTIIVSQLWNAWLWANDPRIRFIGSSHDMSLSISNSLKTRDCINSVKYKSYYPDIILKSDQKNKTDFRTAQGGQRMSTSVTANVVGQHAHVLAPDDLIDPNKIASPDILRRANDHLTRGLTSRKADPVVTVIVLIMQRLGLKDPTWAMLQKFPNVKHIVLPASDEFPINPPEAKSIYINGLLDPTRKPVQELERQRMTVGDADYNAQFGQCPEATSGSIINTKSFTAKKLAANACDIVLSYRFEEGVKTYRALAFRTSMESTEVTEFFTTPNLAEFKTVVEGMIYAYTSPTNTVFVELTKDFKPHIQYL